MNWIITTQSEAHTLGFEQRQGAPLVIDFNGNFKEVRAKLFRTVCHITAIGETATAVSENGQVLVATWDSDKADVVIVREA